MPDNKDKTAPLDASRININEEHELQYWTKTLGISKEKLTSLVKEVGTSADAVKRALNK